MDIPSNNPPANSPAVDDIPEVIHSPIQAKRPTRPQAKRKPAASAQSQQVLLSMVGESAVGSVGEKQEGGNGREQGGNKKKTNDQAETSGAIPGLSSAIRQPYDKLIKGRKEYYTYTVMDQGRKKVVLSDIKPTLFDNLKVDNDALSLLNKAKEGNRFIAVIDVRNGRFFVAPSDISYESKQGQIKVNGQLLKGPIIAQPDLGLTGHDQLVATVAKGDNIKAGRGTNLNHKNSVVQKQGGKFSYENNFIALNITSKVSPFHLSC